LSIKAQVYVSGNPANNIFSPIPAAQVTMTLTPAPVLGIVLGFGIIGVWVAMCVEWAVRGTVFLLRINGKKWYKHKVIEEKM
ncbi:MAG: hypothetical protein RR540_06930, partial [Oscillospiraceae bacterium]